MEAIEKESHQDVGIGRLQRTVIHRLLQHLPKQIAQRLQRLLFRDAGLLEEDVMETSVG